MKTIGYAAHDPQLPLTPWEFDRRALRADDIALDILYCGVCHSDLHIARNHWGVTRYPLVPGHEIIGRVVAVGEEVSRYRVGDHVAVGCMVDSCQQCDQCHQGEEQFCRQGMTSTYGGRDRITGERTQGGYAHHLVVREKFVLKVPDGLDLARAAPLLCAGITAYSPLRTWQVGPGSRVAIIGLGGLGHMAVKFAVAMGAQVTVLGRTQAKAPDATALGATAFLATNDAEAMAAARASFDLIVDTIPVQHDLKPYLPLLDIDGTLTVVGQIGPVDTLSTVPLISGRRRVAGSAIGGIAQTQEMLEFCAAHNILPECEMIPMQQINEAFDRMEQGDVRYRFVIDMASLAQSPAV